MNIASVRPMVKAGTAAASIAVLAALGVLFFGPTAVVERVPAWLPMTLAAAAFAGLVFLQATAPKPGDPSAPKPKGALATVVFAALVVVALFLLLLAVY